MENLRFYMKEEQKEAIFTYADGLKGKINGDLRAVVEAGEKITLLGEFTAISTGLNFGEELKQYIFAKDDMLLSIYEGHVSIIPEAKVGDYARIKWRSGSEDYYELVKNACGYDFQSLNKLQGAFAERETIEELIAYAKKSHVVLDLEILPKKDHMLTVSKN